MFQKVNFKRVFVATGICFAVFIGLLFFIFSQENSEFEPEPVKPASRCYVVPMPKPWNCTSDCSGHQAGYNWAKQNDIRNPAGCEGGKSASFRDGCEYFVQEYMHFASYDMCYGQYE